MAKPTKAKPDPKDVDETKLAGEKGAAPKPPSEGFFSKLIKTPWKFLTGAVPGVFTIGLPVGVLALTAPQILTPILTMIGGDKLAEKFADLGINKDRKTASVLPVALASAGAGAFLGGTTEAVKSLAPGDGKGMGGVAATGLGMVIGSVALGAICNAIGNGQQANNVTTPTVPMAAGKGETPGKQA